MRDVGALSPLFISNALSTLGTTVILLVGLWLSTDRRGSKNGFPEGQAALATKSERPAPTSECSANIGVDPP
ncbi:MAG: hypothetical protein JO081_08455 [Alphaproteobacteria bacterium]|nr:hypothetical protein [Alphaproteobacteria bacterium]